eukprot:7350875-Prymnesium_polylepis.1
MCTWTWHIDDGVDMVMDMVSRTARRHAVARHGAGLFSSHVTAVACAPRQHAAVMALVALWW